MHVCKVLHCTCARRNHGARAQGPVEHTCKEPHCTCARHCRADVQGPVVHVSKELQCVHARSYGAHVQGAVCVCVCALTSTLPAGCRWLATVTPSHMSSMMYLSGSPGRARCESWGGDPLHPPHRPQSSRAGEADVRAHPGGVWGGSHALFSSMSSRSQSLLEGERGQA